MKVFLGWSGDTSHNVAMALRDWLPKVIQAIKPFVSSEDIAKGARWAAQIAEELQATNYGIICVTNENSDSVWINFEAGALSREINKSYVTPFLFNLKPSEVQGPLALFQAVVNEEAEIWKLLASINSREDGKQQLKDGALKEAFEVWWPHLRDKLVKIGAEETGRPIPKKRDPQEMLEELLEFTKVQQRELWARADDESKMFKAVADNQMRNTAELAGMVSALARSVEALYRELANPMRPSFDNLGIGNFRSLVSPGSTLAGLIASDPLRSGVVGPVGSNDESAISPDKKK